MHLSINFCGYAFFDKIVLSLSTSWWNFEKSEDKLKQRFNKVCTKPNLYSSGIKIRNYHESNWLEDYPKHFKPVYYKRYVDDVFVLFDKP